jgi:hypothetical protein
MIMTNLKVLTVVTAIFAGETSVAMAQSILPWEYILAPGVLHSQDTVYRRDMPLYRPDML